MIVRKRSFSGSREADERATEEEDGGRKGETRSRVGVAVVLIRP